jgi:hypothetical protein
MPEQTLRQIREETHFLSRIALGAVGCWALLATLATAAMIVIVLHTQSTLNRADIALRHSNRAVAEAVSARTLATAIQANRRTLILSACEDQNNRHNATIRQLDKILTQAEKHAKTSARKAQVQQSRGPTVLLINALLPVRNCQQQAQRAATHG